MTRFFPTAVALLSLALALTPPTWAAEAGHDARTRAYFTDLELVNQDGEPLRFYSDVLKNRVVLINFIFTNCDGACPLLTHKLSQVREALGEPEGRAVRFVSISIDPEQDTPQALRDYAKRFKADPKRWLFLTGAKRNVDHIVKKLGQYAPDKQAHSTLLLAGNVSTRHWTKIKPSTPVPAIAEKLRALATEG